MLLECMSLELEELAQTRHSDRMITEELTLEVLELQERINSSMSSTPEQAKKRKESNHVENRSRERDIVRKGM